MQRVLAVSVMTGVLLATVGIPAFATEGTDFVCPVFNSEAVGEHNPNAVEIGGGDFTVLPDKADRLNVPDGATNGDGAGSPGGSHSSPGDRDYSAIWNG